jgi:malic enzyme
MMDLKRRALEYHKGGKIGTSILTSIDDKEDLSLAYSPGVAEPCLEISKDEIKVYDYTSKGNRVAVISNGTAVLGLGNIGAVASKPVMEGKALLFKYFAGIDAVDVEVDTEDVSEFVRAVELISGTYGAINLEDIKAPECFEIEEALKEKLGIPVFHDDQHGTAIVVGAGLLNALRVTGKEIDEVKVVMNGAGAAGIAIGRMLKLLGVKDIVMCDSKGIVSRGNLNNGLAKYKEEFAVDYEGKLEDAMKGADVFVGVSKGNLLNEDMMKSMNEKPIVFALANPDPEVSWEDAHAWREDVVMATGRSDFDNQVNNVLAFPGVFRGALDCRAVQINEEMKVGAVKALSSLCDGVEGCVIPDVFDKKIMVSVAVAVACAAVESGVAGDGFDLEGYRGRLEGEFL